DREIHEDEVKRTLTITGIRAEDEGEYSCETRDDKTSVMVTLKGMSLKLKSENVKGFLSVFLSCYSPAKFSLFMYLYLKPLFLKVRMVLRPIELRSLGM
uniref:Uncharacterized protein n=1 Tax=Apteryx owenii TaxID=8824 RepID=A0A8B9SD02_APTOW